jgi:hypothetical protein
MTFVLNFSFFLVLFKEGKSQQETPEDHTVRNQLCSTSGHQRHIISAVVGLSM